MGILHKYTYYLVRFLYLKLGIFTMPKNRDTRA